MAISYIPFAFPGVSGVRCAFQTRVQGHSSGGYGGGNLSFVTKDVRASVIANRQDLHTALGLDSIAELSQVHGDVFHFEPPAVAVEDAPRLEGDGFACSRPGLGLMIKTADCQPLLLTHKAGKHIAALHVGWRGNRINFPASGVALFCEHYGLEVQDVFAVRGPSLGPGCAEFVNYEREWNADFDHWYDAHQKTLDLWSLTRYQLEKAGLSPSHIYGLDLCTATLNDQFFSYRREKDSGRQGSIIWIEE